MVVVKTVEEFCEKNEKELRAFMTYKTGIKDVDMINDTIQEFYKGLIMYHSLELYDENRAPTEEQNKLNFETWICNNLCWLLNIMKRRNFRDRFEVYSQVDTCSEKPGSAEPVDVWEVLDTTKNNNFFSVDERYKVSQVEQEQENGLNREMNAFLRYIERNLPEKKSKEIKNFILYRAKGLNNTDISYLLGKSNNMIKIIRQDAERRYNKWKKIRIKV